MRERRARARRAPIGSPTHGDVGSFDQGRQRGRQFWAQMYTSLGSRVLDSPTMEGLALRYGFFYGPNTWYHPKGGADEQVRQQPFPIVGAGEGVWSFVQVEDAALATTAALTGPPGV